MNRKVLGGLVVLVLAAAAIWFLWLRDRGEGTRKAVDVTTGRTAELPDKPATPTTQSDAPAPRGVAPKWTLDVDPEGTLQLEGQVQGPDGSGVGGATVRLSSVPPRTTTTQDDGTFSFDKLVGRPYYLSASSGELVGGPVSYKLTASSDPVVIRMTEGAKVIVTVVDDKAQPIEGAEVEANEDTKQKTDAQGKATLAPVKPGWIGVEASAPGYARNSSFTTVGSAGATGQLTITLQQGFAVSGKVIDERGKPIAKARVRGASSGGWWGEAASDEAITDDQGQFQIAALAAGSHTLAAVDGEHAPARSSPITVKDRAITGIVITMQAGGVYAGHVVAGDGKPVPFATVRIAGKGQDAWRAATPRQATTDKAGAFELRGLARIALQARAESDAAASQIVAVDLAAQPEVTDAKLVLDVTGKIAGTVVDESGAPVPEVQVNAFPDLLGGGSMEGLALAGMSSATSDGAGAFVVSGLPEGAYRLWAARSSGGWNDWGQQGVQAKVGDTQVKITLASPGELVGKVALADGEAPAVASVQIGSKAPTPAQQGAFSIKDVAPGSYDVTFRGPEFAETIQRDVKIEPGKATDMGTVTVQRGRRVTGRVVDKAGPVAGAKVRIGQMLFSSEANQDRLDSFEEVSGIRSAETDQRGEFTVIGVSAKGLTVQAEHAERGRSLGVSIPEGTTDPAPLTLTLKGFGSLAGKVTMKGEPQGNVTISVSPKGGGATAVFAQTDDTGAFLVSRVPEGPIIIQASKTGMMTMKSTTVTANVTAGRQTTVAIDIPVGNITLLVEIKAQPNQQVDSAQVFLFNGVAAAQNAKQLTDTFFQGGVQGMKFWLGKSLPFPEFDELVPGGYSVCTIPITGDLSDPKFQGRLQEHSQSLKVYCKQLKITASPTKQTVVHAVPAMEPLPEPAP